MERKRKAAPLAKEKDRKRKAMFKLKSVERNTAMTDFHSRVSAFKGAVKEGPYFICVVCNRCLYRKTVRQFDPSKYDCQFLDLFTTVDSYDFNRYICLTCNKHILKKKIPCQSVWNKLVLDNIPEEICVLNRLEKILISKRILFKKLSIMPKGQQPKIKGAICNIPVQTNAITNCLPRKSDDEIILVKLKRKMIFRGHVYFESVRPDFVEAALNFLKHSNPFYSDVLINIDNITSDLLSLSDIDAMIEKDEYLLTIENPDEENSSDNEAVNPLDNERINCDEMCAIPNIYNDDSSTLEIAPGENKTPLSFFHDDFCEEQSFPYLLPNGKFGYKVERAVPLSAVKYFNQRLLNYTQRFSSSSDYIFFAQYIMQQINLFNQINIATCKVKGSINAGQLNNNLKETLRHLICEDKGYSFMKSVKGTPAYWKSFLYDVLAMVKQKGLPTYFLTLSCADLRWNELLFIIAKLNRIDVSDEEMSYFKKCELLNKNPVLTARHFQYRVETFFKEIILHKNGPFGEVESYAIKVEFQARGSPHIHSFIWVKDSPVLTTETRNEYIAFVDSLIRADLPDKNLEPELFKLVSQYQTHSHSRSCRKYKNVPCRFNYGRFFTNRTICAKPLPNEMNESEKIQILNENAKILQKAKHFIDEYLNPHKSSYKGDISISKILDLLSISEELYYNALSISPDDDFHIHLRRLPDSCFVNNYFAVGLEAWEANMDIQPVFNYYKAISYMCSYFSKCETESSVAIKKAVEESQNLNFKERMKKVALAFLSHRQCSVQEAVYQLLPELWLRKTFPAVTFANTNLPDKRHRVCKSEKELRELPDDSTDVFKKNNLDRYLDRPGTTFKGGKYRVLDQFCYAQFLAYYYLDTTVSLDEKIDSQPEVLLDDDIEQPLLYPKLIPLMSCKEKMRCRNVKKVLRYHTPNINVNAEAYAHHLLMLFYPFRKESDLLFQRDQTYFSKLNECNVLKVVNQNKEIYEPWGDMVDLSLQQFIFRPRTDAFAEQENDEINSRIENSNNIDENGVDFLIEPRAPAYSRPSINVLMDSEINNLICSLNRKQREVFNSVISWAKKSVINRSARNVCEIKPLHIFITGGAGTGKSHLIKTLYAALMKILNYNSQSPEHSKVILLAPTGVAAVNIAGTTIHSALGIPVDCRGMQIPKLSNKRRCSLRMQLQDLKAIIIDEISMVSNKLLLHIHQRLLDIFGYSNNFLKPFAGITLIVVGDLYQLPPVMQRPVFADYHEELYNINHLWRVFKMCELTEVMRQRGDMALISMLNNVRVGNLTQNDVVLLQKRFVDKENDLFPTDSLHIFAENEPARLHNAFMLQKIQSPLITIDAIDQVPNGVPNHVYDRILNLKQSQTNGLAFKLSVKVGSRVMLTNNVDISDKLINGQIGSLVYIKWQINIVKTMYIKFDNETVGITKRMGDSLAFQYDAVPIECTTAEIKTNAKKEAAPVIKRTQFPLVLSWACTVHKVQGLSLNYVVVSFDLLKQKSFNPGQMYVALSRVTSLEGLFLTGTFKDTAIVVDKRAKDEYQFLRENSRFKPNDEINDGKFCIALCNVRSLKKHLHDIKGDRRFTESNLILCTETQIEENDYIDVEIERFSVLLNNCAHKYSSTAVYSLKDIKKEEHFRTEGFFVVHVESVDITIQLILCYRKIDLPIMNFYEILRYLSAAHNPDLILGDFNTEPNDELSHILNGFQLLVNEPTHIAGATLDHVYVSNNFLKTYNVGVSVESIFFSDHELVKISVESLCRK